MNAVGAHQDVAVRAGAVRTGAVKEIGGNAGFILAERAKAIAGMDVLLANPLRLGVMDHALHPAAMDRKLRQIITGIHPARLAPDLLAEAIGIEQLVSADRDRIEPLQQSQCSELLDRMRQRIDSDTELADLVGLLEDLALDAARMQHQRGGEPADSAACDDHFHGSAAGEQTSAIKCQRSEYQITWSPSSGL